MYICSHRIDKGMWTDVTRVLGKQEMLYSTELEDFGHHLSQASQALSEVSAQQHSVII